MRETKDLFLVLTLIGKTRDNLSNKTLNVFLPEF